MVSMPTPARALKTPFSVVYRVPVSWVASLRNDQSFGMKAVTGTLPLVSTATGLFGLALITASAASVTMS